MANQTIPAIQVKDSNVGIGTVTPGAKLHVYGSGQTELRIGSSTGNTNSLLSFYEVGLASWGIDAGQANGSFFIKDLYNSATRLTILNSGNVGIGTTAPAEKLDVSGNIRIGTTSLAQTILHITSSTTGISDIFFNDNVENRGVIRYDHTSDFLSLWSAGSERMRITAAGNVGIGTTAPSTRFQVNKGSSGNVASFTTETNTAGAYAGITLNSTTQGADDWYGSEIRNINVNGNPNFLNPRLAFFVQNTNTYLPADRGEKMTINGDGNVGIGTTSPAYKLDVAGTISNNSAQNIIYASYDAVAALFQRVGTYGGVIQLGRSGVSNSTTIDYPADGTFAVSTASSERMRITAAGNVGIGTTAPGSKLQVETGADGRLATFKGTAGNTTDFGFDSVGSYIETLGASSGRQKLRIQTYNGSAYTQLFIDGANQYIYTSSNVNVGIGTTSPSYKLDVAGGDVRFVAAASTDALVRIIAANYATEYDARLFLGENDTNGMTIEYDGSNNVGFIGMNSSTDPTGAYSKRIRMSRDGSEVSFPVGNVGIGTTAPDTPLGSGVRGIVINSGASNDAQVRLQNNATGSTSSDGGLLSISGGLMYLWNYEANVLIFGTNNSERMRLDSSGNLGVGNTSPSYKVDITGDARILSGSLGVGVAPNATDGRIDASNDIVAYSTSDQRLKENVTPIENALEKVKTLTGVEFDWKEETAHVHGYHGHDVGIIAQDVQAVLPEAVRTNDSGYLSVRYEKMIALLIEANKELAARVELLEQKLKQQ